MSGGKFRSKRPKMLPFTNATLSEVKKIQRLTAMTTRLRGDCNEEKVTQALEVLQQVGVVTKFWQTKHYSPEDHFFDFNLEVPKPEHLLWAPHRRLPNTVNFKEDTISICLQVKSGAGGCSNFWQQVVKGENVWVPILIITPGSSLEEVVDGLKKLINKVLAVVGKKHKCPPPVIKVGEKEQPQMVKVKRNNGRWVIV